MLTLDVDEEEHPIPVDERVSEDIENYFREIVHDLDGITIKTFRIIGEKRYEQQIEYI